MMASNFRELKKCSAFTLVELLVAMVIGLFIVGGVVSVMVDSKDNFIFEQEVAFIQENARFVSDELSHEIRMAGFKGCNEAELVNYADGSAVASPLPSPPPAPLPGEWAKSGRGLWGYDSVEIAGGIDVFGNDLITRSDVLIINRGNQNDLNIVENHTPGTGVFNLRGSESLEANGLAIVGDIDCSRSAIFEISGVTAGTSTGAGTVRYAAANGPSQRFSEGSFLMAYTSSAYYVKESVITGLPTLYKEVLNSNSSSATDVQELISGVELFDVVYGVDISTSYDGEIDVYLTANDIREDIATATSNWVGWDRVISARVTMVLRSRRDLLPELEGKDLGDDINLPDARHLRQKVVLTARARNRGL